LQEVEAYFLAIIEERVTLVFFVILKKVSWSVVDERDHVGG
jgi:hypothetical protein